MAHKNIKNVSHAYSYDAVETAIKQQHMKRHRKTRIQNVCKQHSKEHVSASPMHTNEQTKHEDN
jgi:uncharacterized Fe-S center protein